MSKFDFARYISMSALTDLCMHLFRPKNNCFHCFIMTRGEKVDRNIGFNQDRFLRTSAKTHSLLASAREQSSFFSRIHGRQNVSP